MFRPALPATVIALAVAMPAVAADFVDVLDSPARASALAETSLMQSVASAGRRLVAVGQRGHVVTSSDGGRSWQQSRVPVSSDLTSVHFVDAREGWAVGHDGVVLHSADGGDSWEVQLDGRSANTLLVDGMERRVAADPQSEAARSLLAEAKRYHQQGADKPFLDVWFADAKRGFVVGAYNLVFRTVDGGKTWESWFDRTENPKLFNFYAIHRAGDDLYIAGEGGLVLKLDPAGERFRALRIPYNGSFFGLASSGRAVIVYGLRGNAYRSEDAGATWAKVEPGLPASIVASVESPDGALFLADAGGRIAASRDGGHSFTPLVLSRPMPLAGIASAGEGRLVLAGPRGVFVTDARRRAP